MFLSQCREYRVGEHPGVVRPPALEGSVPTDGGSVVVVQAKENGQLECPARSVGEAATGRAFAFRGFLLEPPDVSRVALRAREGLQPQVQGVKCEGGKGAVGGAVAPRVVHGQELDHLQPRAPAPPAEGRQVRELPYAATVPGPQGGDFDASTLHGKIEVVGPDAAEFMEQPLHHPWAKLGVGRCRYGLMLNEQGFLMDDGVIARMASDRFHVTTTTGGAPRVLNHMEDYLQTDSRS